MITIENLSKSFGGNHALKKINLELKKGVVYGFVGENGSGKTTLFNCLSGIESYNGNIKSNFKRLKDHIGYLQTEPFFFSKITGEEYINLFSNARGFDAMKISDKNIFNLPLNQYVSSYSTGMKKKIALTAILFQKNDIYIFDEPFNGIDISGNMIIDEIILKLKSLNKLILISSHIYSTLAKSCDEIHLIQKGKLTEKVERKDFKKLETKMKQASVRNLIEKLDLK